MDLKKKQSYSEFIRSEAKKRPDYSITELAGSWGGDIIRDMSNNGSYPGTVEHEEILENCFNRILNAIENGELQAIYPENRILPEERFGNGELIRGELKPPQHWIIETSKYIEWAKANGAGPGYLVEDIEPFETSSNLDTEPKEEKPLDGRERNTMLKIIAALCEKAGVSANDDQLHIDLELITQKLGVPVERRTIDRHLARAAEIVK